MPDPQRSAGSGLLDQLPTDRLTEQGQQLLGLLVDRAIDRAVGSVEDLAERLIDHAYHGGPGLFAAISGGRADTGATTSLRSTVKAGVTGASESVKQAISGVTGSSGSGRTSRTMNIDEQVDVGVPVRLAYNQWTRFQDFSQFMKKVRSVEKTSAELSTWKVRFFWSHRDWESTIIEQVPDERIIWRSTGAKGYVDGTVSFHALAPNMTRILLALEYHPDGLLERAGSLWCVHSRSVRLEIKQFRHHVMTRAVLDPDSAQGWRGEIRDGQLVYTHEEALAREHAESQERTKVPDAPTETGDDNTADTDTSAVEHDDIPDEYDEQNEYDEPDDAYDDSDDLYDDEPVREPARSRTR